MSGVKAITVLDCYHRGVWLAAELASKGYEVNWLDCTEAMGPWAMEDREGPFAIFTDDVLSGSQKEFLFLPGLIEHCKRGMTIRQGADVIEFKGPFLKEKCSQYGLSTQMLDRLKGKDIEISASSFSPAEKILALSHQYGATKLVPSIEAAQIHQPTAFALEASIRRLSRRDLAQVSDWCHLHGANVFKKVNIGDVSISSRRYKGLEVRSSQFSGYLASDEIYSFLSMEELNWLSPEVAEKIFPGKKVEPQYNWLRYRFKLSNHPVLNNLPIHWLQVNDIDLPWSNENFILINATYDIELFDLWVRIPTNQRFRSEYIDRIGYRLYEFLKALLPSLTVHLHEKPQESLYGYSELGPSPFPIFSANQPVVKSKTRAWNHCGPENYGSHEKRSMMKYLMNLFNHIQAEGHAERNSVEVKL